MKRISGLLGLAVAAMAVQTVAVAETAPQPVPAPPPTPSPVDTPFQGVIGLAVDATDLPHGIFRAHETIPIAGPGPVTLLYPQWLPGNHSPTGPIDKLAGLTFTAGGRPLPWRRDPVDVYAFHVDAPAGATSIDIDLQFLSAVSSKEGRVMMTPRMLSLQWNTIALYPAGHFARQIRVRPSVRVPPGFTLATALETASSANGATVFAPVDFETLVDSPLIAGLNFRRFNLDPDGPARVTLDVMADLPQDLLATADEIAAHRAMVQQAYRLFGSRHFAHYDFLVSLSDRLGGIGLEHLQSSEDGAAPKYFTDWEGGAAGRDLLAHEFTHSWNGKFRRPADLWTPNFNTPMRGSLLWVYEGQTQYWGFVLAARAGLLTRTQALDAIASTAAAYDHRVGRGWRPLEDTTNDPVIAMRRPLSWLSWQRSEDYYSEGELVWLDTDTLIRKLSNGARSLDDFARVFFGVENGAMVTDTYDFDDVVAALTAVQPYDWAGFLHARLEGHGPGAPLDGIARGGYRLIYDEDQNSFLRSTEMRLKNVDLTYSLGFVCGHDGVVTDVLWDGPAFRLGLTEGAQVVAVNNITFSADDLKDAVRAAKGAGPGIDLLI
jgi:predicted metalloprotease with PDZ domain